MRRLPSIATEELRDRLCPALGHTDDDYQRTRWRWRRTENQGHQCVINAGAPRDRHLIPPRCSDTVAQTCRVSFSLACILHAYFMMKLTDDTSFVFRGREEVEIGLAERAFLELKVTSTCHEETKTAPSELVHAPLLCGEAFHSSDVSSGRLRRTKPAQKKRFGDRCYLVLASCARMRTPRQDQRRVSHVFLACLSRVYHEIAARCMLDAMLSVKVTVSHAVSSILPASFPSP